MKSQLLSRKLWQILFLPLLLWSAAAYADVEPNNAFTEANPLMLNTTQTGSLFQNPANDTEDWYQLTLPANGNVTLTATYEAGLSGFIYIHNSAGGQLNFANSGTGTLTVNCIAAGTIYVRATRTGGSGSYSLSVSLAQPSNLTDVEPNGNSNAVQSIAMIQETFEEGVEWVGQLGYTNAAVSDDQDWFYIINPRDGNATLTVNFDTGLNGFIYLYNKTGGQYGFSSIVGGNTATFTANCVAQDTLVARLGQTSGCGSYTASFSTNTLANAIDIEPNGNTSVDQSIDMIQETFEENEVFTGHLGHIDTDTGTDVQDWFYLINPRDGNATLTVNFDTGLTGFIYLYSKTGTQYGFSAITGGTTATFTANCVAQDTIIARIGQSSGCGSYTASFATNTLANAIDVEPNGNTNAIQSIDMIQATFQEGDEITGHLGYIDTDTGTDTQDWFYIINPRDGDVTLTATYDTGVNGFIYLYEKDGTQIGFSSIAGGTPATFTALCYAADTLVARFGQSSGCGSYTASFVSTPPTNAGDMEPNGNTSALASINEIQETFDAGEIWTGHLGYIDADTGQDIQDWFYVVSPTDGNVVLNVTFTGTLSGFIYLYEKDGSQIGFSSIGSNTSATFTANCYAADTLVARIGQSGGCGSYTASITTAPLGFANDAEPNGNSSAAASILVAIPSNNSTVNQGHLGYDDVDTGLDSDDWYQITVTQVPFAFEAKLEKESPFSGFLYLYNSAGGQVGFVSHAGLLTQTLSFSLNTAGNYYVRVNSTSGCGAYSLGNFCGTAPDVAISFTGEPNICPGESILLSATAGLDAYSWLLNGQEVSTAQTYSATMPGTYQVIGFDANGCDGLSEELIIGVFNVPAVSITANGELEFCEGGSVTLTATAGFDSYSWSNGASGSSIVVSSSGDYSVTATTTDGCDKVSANTIVVNVLNDADNDGTCDFEDGCPDDPNKIDAGLCGCGAPDIDLDNDQICDTDDDCVGTPDALGVCNGDCAADTNENGICDDEEECLGVIDAIGVCDGDCLADADGDLICDDVDDCVGTPDAIGVCNGECAADADGDGICDDADDCVGTPDAIGVCNGECTADADGDLICDDVDNCIGTPDAIGVCNGDCTADTNENGICDDEEECLGVIDAIGVCDGDCLADADGDLICDDVDDCVGQIDAVGVCNGACDFDADADGICDDVDDCVGEPDAIGVCNGTCDADINENGICDTEEDCLGVIDAIGVCDGDCQADADGDLICDDVDDCVGEPDVLGVCNGDCLADEDGDGVCDNEERFGCTDMAACNFDPEATEEDGTCILNGSSCDLTDDTQGILVNCQCEPLIVGECQNYKYYLSDALASGATNIYEVVLSGTNASLSLIASSSFEVAIAYNELDNLIYAVDKTNGSYRTLNPNTAAWGPVTLINATVQQIVGAAINADGKLLISSQSANTIYDVDLNTQNVGIFDSYSPTLGGDIAFGSDGALYHGSREGGGSLFLTIPQEVAADILLGTVPALVTGIANTANDQLIISSQNASTLAVRNYDGSMGASYSMMLNGNPFTTTFGDLASGCADDEPIDECNYALYYVHTPQSGSSSLRSVELNNDGTATTNILLNNTSGHIALSPDGNTIYLVGGSNTLRVYDVASNSIVNTIPMLTASNQLVNNPPVAVCGADGTLYVASGNKVYAVNPATGLAVQFGPNRSVSGGDLVFLPSGADNADELWLLTRNNSRMTNVLTGAFVVLPVSAINGASVLENGNLLIADGNLGSLLKEINWSTLAIEATYDTGLSLFYGDLAGGCTNGSAPAVTFVEMVSQEEVAETPTSNLTSFPNPTTGSSQVVFAPASTGRTILEVYDMNGRNVATLFNQEAQAGQEYRADFEGAYLPNGVYIYRLTTVNEVIINKFMISK